MRLTCPNCGAQYEVPDGVIPTEGRDVQCSNCGNTWFQDHPDSTPDTVRPAAEDDWDAGQDVPPTDEEADTETPFEDGDFQTGVDPDAYEDEDLDLLPADPVIEESDQQPPSPQATGARGLDPSISEILREEAEREAQIRAHETPDGLETQTEMGLEEAVDDEPARRARQARDRMARIKGEEPTAVVEDTSGSRRGLLPDIEEINSTLRSSTNAVASADQDADQDAIEPVPEKRGFARGFALVLMIAVGMGVLYKMAPQIAQSVPQADPMISAYVALVDQARVWLDTLIGPLLGSIRGE
ncbi:zinc-ribbon domain-containing protein [Rhodobacteraceae bacterium M382]|nr:zinc-ribbon domain-containing protein [Rhodobacteraceae bacterium M382]